MTLRFDRITWRRIWFTVLSYMLGLVDGPEWRRKHDRGR